MKKRILSLALVVVMVALVAAGSMAYFTDSHQVTNTFAVGDFDISLTETVDGEIVDGYDYENIVPGDEMNKVVTVTNEGDTAAYVALAIKQDNWRTFNKEYIDDYYEAKGYTAEQMQEVTDAIFSGDGWNGLSYDKKTNGFDVRYYPADVNPVDQDGSEAQTGDAVQLIAVDYTVHQNTPGYAAGYMNNMFGTQFQDGDYTLSKCTGGEIYGSMNPEERMWVYYLYLPAGESYTLDLTVTCPTFITTDNAAAFDILGIDVQAAAIQVDNFDSAKAAFTELYKTYDFSF